MSDVEDLWRKLFQSTLPQGERLNHLICLGKGDLFQSTLPQGERHFLSAHDKNDFFISIHAPTRGATVFRKFQMTTQVYFNPRSHKGSDFDGDTRFKQTFISIHAPTRGATFFGIHSPSRWGISIHAPTRGATECA